MTMLERCELAKAKGYKYNPDTGELIGIKGNVIISKDRDGYIQASIYSKKYYPIRGHRLAWYLYYGKLPKNKIDHIDCDRSNNRINNLRDVTNQQNNFNNSKAKGYVWHSIAKKFQAKITVGGKIIYLGLFVDEQDARNAYLEAKKKYHVIK